ncbi:ABC transporter permease [Gottfriedia luciferensis]|uniref:ABC transporter permease n=1 Tax=Gottfriedia luciferensis TaxID=178774 RepID=UPI000B452D76|nr:ABC transporter permease [Gottfriedia luciferensis]
MIKLIQNEWIKIIKRPGTIVMFALVILLVGATGTFVKYNQDKKDARVDQNWKQTIQAQTEGYKSDLKKMGDKNISRPFLERTVAINEYRLKHDISPYEKTSVWTFLDVSSSSIVLVGLFTIIIAANIVASEFNWGTIKLLLIRPFSRRKIILSKYITSVLFGFVLLFTLFIVSTVLGLILFSTGDGNTSYLAYVDGKVVEQSRLIYSAKFYLMSFIETFMLATMAFMISTVFRNNTIAIGLSILLLTLGSMITNIVASYFDWAKYILFANTDLMQYINGTPLVKGMTMTFSVVMLLVYFVIFIGLALGVFSKRDVTA